MKNNNTIIMIIILIIILLPSESKISISKTWADDINKYSLLENEGFVAFECNESNTISNIDDSETKCECNGSGIILTGDNRKIKCPCSNCKCKNENKIELNLKSAPEDSQKKNTVQEEKDYIPLLDGRCILFTNPEWCIPCRQLEEYTLKELRKAGYKFGKITDKKIHIILLDENSPMFEKYGNGSIPTFLFIKSGKIVKTLTGYQTSDVISREINEVVK